MSLGHDGERRRRRGRGRRGRGRDARGEADGNNNAGEWTDAERDQMLRGLREKLRPRVGTVAVVAQWSDAPQLTRQGVVNVVGRYAGANALSFDESLMELSVRARTLGGADSIIAFALQRGVPLDAPDDNQPNGGSTGMARTKKQEEQRRAREEREAAAKGGASKGAQDGQARAPRRIPRQPELPDEGGGFAQETIPDIDAASEAYLTLRDEHAELTKRLSDAKAHLMDRMKHHKQERYKWEGYVVVYTHEEAENVKLEKAKKSAADEPADV